MHAPSNSHGILKTSSSSFDEPSAPSPTWSPVRGVSPQGMCDRVRGEGRVGCVRQQGTCSAMMENWSLVKIHISSYIPTKLMQLLQIINYCVYVHTYSASRLPHSCLTQIIYSHTPKPTITPRHPQTYTLTHNHTHTIHTHTCTHTHAHTHTHTPYTHMHTHTHTHTHTPYTHTHTPYTHMHTHMHTHTRATHTS